MGEVAKHECDTGFHQAGTGKWKCIYAAYIPQHYQAQSYADDSRPKYRRHISFGYLLSILGFHSVMLPHRIPGVKCWFGKRAWSRRT